MTQGDVLISLLLAVIVYFLYHIAKQLSHLTNVKIQFKLPRMPKYHGLSQKRKQEEPEEKLVN